MRYAVAFVAFGGADVISCKGNVGMAGLTSDRRYAARNASLPTEVEPS